MDRYKIQARKHKGDKWQEFTGIKKTTIEQMVNHCKIHLVGLPYQFGIFRFETVFVPVLNKPIVKWVLRKIII